MPVELLRFTPVYVLVGAYRFIHDDKINRPIWCIHCLPTLPSGTLLTILDDSGIAPALQLRKA